MLIILHCHHNRLGTFVSGSDLRVVLERDTFILICSTPTLRSARSVLNKVTCSTLKRYMLI
jgi:hypothetical protein